MKIHKLISILENTELLYTYCIEPMSSAMSSYHRRMATSVLDLCVSDIWRSSRVFSAGTAEGGLRGRGTRAPPPSPTWNLEVAPRSLQRMPRVRLAYKPYVLISTIFLASLKKGFCPSIYQCMSPYATACLKRTQSMPYVPPAYTSVSDVFHTLAYAITIRNNLTGRAIKMVKRVSLGGVTCCFLKTILAFSDIQNMKRAM